MFHVALAVQYPPLCFNIALVMALLAIASNMVQCSFIVIGKLQANKGVCTLHAQMYIIERVVTLYCR